MKFPEQFRWTDAPCGYATLAGDRFGAFIIPARAAKGRALKVLTCDGLDTGWEHVSVSLADKQNKPPTWDEMCLVKRLFWTDNECVVQFHPAQRDYVNQHPGVLHLWKRVDGDFPMPPKICV